MTGANYEFKIDADSGYRSVMMGRCSDTQYAQVCAVLHGKEPLAKPWVDLTEDEIEVLDRAMCGDREFALAFARAVQTELRNKNK